MSEASFMYDPVLRRPGCVLIQAALQCQAGPCDHWDPNLWLTAPSKNLMRVRASPAQLRFLAEKDATAKRDKDMAFVGENPLASMARTLGATERRMGK